MKKGRKLVGFAGIIPVSRRLYSRDLFLKRLSIADAERLLGLIRGNRRRLEKWLPRFPEKVTLDMVRLDIRKQQSEARSARDLALGIWDNSGGKLSSRDGDVPGARGGHPPQPANRPDGDALAGLIGRITLHSIVWGVSRSCGLGYWLDKNWSGRALMRQAVATITSFCFEELGIHKVWASVQPENVYSLKLLEGLGFVREGSRRKELFINGSWRDHFFYSIIDEEYEMIADRWLERGWLGNLDNY